MSAEGSLRCSFCNRTQEEVGNLISRAGTPPSRAYICPECVRVCYSILQEDESEEKPRSDPRE
ncbi:MAG TPA: ClpX C4-type zinc finger protein [Bryobacteraceae bacterium]|nr:ClpX C4-type zinc finger protein [Bryobacteraceae bacterium]